MPPRFYVPEARDDESTIELPQEEATHLTRVLRLASGDHIRIFNGRGDEWDAWVDETSKRHVSVRLGGRVPASAEPHVRITLAAAVLKGEKMDDVVRDAVMLGAAAIMPLVTARTEISRAAIERGRRVERWQRIAIASAKQCGRAVVPFVHQPASFLDAVSSVNDGVMFVEPAINGSRNLRHLSHGDHLTVFIGPEGGWTEEEITQGRDSGAMLLTLGAQTLRADAVPTVALTALRVRLEDL